jgi:hypothetical protein
VSNRELTANIRHTHLDTREAGLVDKERRMAEAQPGQVRCRRSGTSWARSRLR